MHSKPTQCTALKPKLNTKANFYRVTMVMVKPHSCPVETAHIEEKKLFMPHDFIGSLLPWLMMVSA